MKTEKTDKGYLYIKRHNDYVKGIVGQDIKLSFRDKLRILFSKGISVAFIGPDVNEEKDIILW